MPLLNKVFSFTAHIFCLMAWLSSKFLLHVWCYLVVEDGFVEWFSLYALFFSVFHPSDLIITVTVAFKLC